MDELEMISINSEDLEEVKKTRDVSGSRQDFPAVTVGKDSFYFNKVFVQLIGTPRAKIKLYTTPQYVIVAEACITDTDVFTLSTGRNGQYGIMRYPSDLREKKIKRGTYRLYKCEYGFAFDRYNPVEGSEK